MCFFLAAFNIFVFIFVFISFMLIHQGAVFFMFILLKFWSISDLSLIAFALKYLGCYFFIYCFCTFCVFSSLVKICILSSIFLSIQITVISIILKPVFNVWVTCMFVSTAYFLVLFLLMVG